MSLPLLLTTLAACNAVPLVSPEPARSTPVMGDTNGDGRADLSDAVYLREFLFHGGRGPVCSVAADVLTDGLVEIGDELAILSYSLGGDTDFAALAADGCPDLLDGQPPEPIHLALAIEPPATASADTTFQATVQLTTPDRPVQGWTLSVVADGCTINAATTDGTDAATVDHGGLRTRHSWDQHELSANGAAAAVLLDWEGQAALDAREDPYSLLQLGVTGPCGTCTLRLEGGQAGHGPQLRNAVTVDAWTYGMPPVEAKIEVCG